MLMFSTLSTTKILKCYYKLNYNNESDNYQIKGPRLLSYSQAIDS
ncbi:unnamed protein product [Brugia timori]|uniref:Uncharacterized protein n=1 Tax=Brugia timori TaxID=42155 RepID=A0A0R3QDY7_9BILA|nr:unnamed protein product [Brugia timori]